MSARGAFLTCRFHFDGPAQAPARASHGIGLPTAVVSHGHFTVQMSECPISVRTRCISWLLPEFVAKSFLWLQARTCHSR